MKKIPTLEQFSYEDKHGRSNLADKLLRSKGIKRGSSFYVGDGFLACRKFSLQIDGYLEEIVMVQHKNVIYGISQPMDKERYEYIYNAVVLGRGHLWKEKKRK